MKANAWNNDTQRHCFLMLAIASVSSEKAYWLNDVFSTPAVLQRDRAGFTG